MTHTCLSVRVVLHISVLTTLLSAVAISQASSSIECLDLAERGECDFYKCLEKTHRCGHTGYALGYGFRYCDRFTVHFHRLTSEGQRWMSAVRKCLMKELLEYYMTAADKTCGTIKTFAFLSHPPCYVKSGPGFCSIITDPRNYDALYRGYQLKDFVGDDWKVVWRQVQQTAFRCGGQMAQGFVDTLHGYYASAVQGWYSMFA
ncbi:hypothetical protein NP493_165g00017 [Ridgeia piscesae]|uniref:Stanniocalcin n=1 Tax=Ridgeia piscesae TaxID=27915 RepID=A0AAD9UFI3_RIDPI|nr:hypothetical protein NP493_165g00017 [Ridgeia piscesae]